MSATSYVSDPLSTLWDSLVRGRLRAFDEVTTRDSVVLVSQIRAEPRALCHAEALLLRSVLCGEARKALAADLGIASSTATGRYMRALTKLDLLERPIPLALVLAAQSSGSVARIPSAHVTYIDREGCRRLSVNMPRPVTACLTALTPVQQQVARWLIEGGTRAKIAERRATSVHTVAGQVHAIFRALRVTGRFALIRRATELGCFSQPAVRVA